MGKKRDCIECGKIHRNEKTDKCNDCRDAYKYNICCDCNKKCLKPYTRCMSCNGYKFHGIVNGKYCGISSIEINLCDCGRKEEEGSVGCRLWPSCLEEDF